jgi:flagellar basal-body rod protein FlgB
VEMVRSVEAQRDHERALSVYRSAMNVLRAGLGR